MSEQYWDEIDGIGKLYLEEELVVGIEPVLVVCVDEVKNRYLIMTYDSYEGIYVYRKIEKIELLDMLENRVTMEETFRRGDKVYMTSMGEDGMLKSEGYPVADFDGGKLPDVGEYYEINSSYIQKYIKALRGYSIEKKNMIGMIALEK